jgi:hypothetical protein
MLWDGGISVGKAQIETEKPFRDIKSFAEDRKSKLSVTSRKPGHQSYDSYTVRNHHTNGFAI